VRNFVFRKGGRIEDCRIGYRTWGRLNETKGNVILVPTWLGGKSADIIGLLGATKAIDTTKFYVIAVDAFGNGVSASPSNTVMPDGQSFPDVTIQDMVREGRHVMDSLGILSLHAVLGGSMGGMQALQYAVDMPHAMRRVVSYVSSLRTSSPDKVLWDAELNAIDEGLARGLPDSTIGRLVGAISTIAIRSNKYVLSHIKADSADSWMAKSIGDFARGFRPLDWKTQVLAIQSHSIVTGQANLYERAAELIRAKMLLIASAQDQMVNPQSLITFGEYSNAKLLVLDNECGHLAPGCEWERFCGVIRDFLGEADF
jgi:homoserine O-acetyltransferase